MVDHPRAPGPCSTGCRWFRGRQGSRSESESKDRKLGVQRRLAVAVGLAGFATFPDGPEPVRRIGRRAGGLREGAPLVTDRGAAAHHPVLVGSNDGLGVEPQNAGNRAGFSPDLTNDLTNMSHVRR